MRLGLRAVWLWLAGVLLAWGANALWGWLPDSRTWFLAGLALSLLPLAEFLRSLSPRSRWVWTMDRRLGLQEQVSTAWSMLRDLHPGDVGAGPRPHPT
jgi:hypothetical protein